MKKHDYKMTAVGARQLSRDNDTAAELARRWNAEPELRAENERLRDLLAHIEAAAMPSGKLNEMNVPLCWIKEARAALAGEAAK